MMEFSENFLVFLSGFLSIIFCALIYIHRRHSHYWTNRGIKTYPKYYPLIGSLKELLTMQISPGEVFQKFYNATDDDILGIFIFHKPGLLIRGSDLVKKMLVKDFEDFSNHYLASNEKNDPVGSNNVFCLRNSQWKIMRNKLTPIYTSGKIKKMFDLMKEVSEELQQHLFVLVNNEKGENISDLREICVKYSVDVIASVAFGLKANSLKDPTSKFREIGHKMTELSFFRRMELCTFYFIPQLIKYFNFQLFSKDASDFLRKATWTAINSREESGIERNDLIDVLIKLKNTPNDGTGLKFEGDTLVAQTAIFFIGGFETSAGAMSFALYEMALNTDIQNRLRKEIKDTIEENNGEITYDTVMKMSYLDMVISETLRKYPSGTFIDRECSNKNGYKLPPPYEGVTLAPGTPVYVSVLGFHMNPKYFPEPERFDPERFSKEQIQARNAYCYFPFGIGPRICLGARFGVLQTKLGLIHILKNYEVNICSKTPVPIKIDPLCVLTAPLGGIPMQIRRI